MHLPTGGCGPGKSLAAAIVRAFDEETGLTVGDGLAEFFRIRDVHGPGQSITFFAGSWAATRVRCHWPRTSVSGSSPPSTYPIRPSRRSSATTYTVSRPPDPAPDTPVHRGGRAPDRTPGPAPFGRTPS
ncbi:NUDIX hydrolase [Kitasatospora sp. NPDC056184]|uniref:NUDIX hydrolase n=1 Tax=Kitasatospora sp. NPDC056184 TaxID=3345738 RepID=UPI0035DE8DCA